MPQRLEGPDRLPELLACLYRGFADTYRLFIGPPNDVEAEAFYQGCARPGTTLQVRPESWPADVTAFSEYWASQLDQLRIDDTVREHLHHIVALRYLPRPIGVLFGPMHRFTTTGFLPPEFRRLMQLPWTPASSAGSTA